MCRLSKSNLGWPFFPSFPSSCGARAGIRSHKNPRPSPFVLLLACPSSPHSNKIVKLATLFFATTGLAAPRGGRPCSALTSSLPLFACSSFPFRQQQSGHLLLSLEDTNEPFTNSDQRTCWSHHKILLSKSKMISYFMSSLKLLILATTGLAALAAAAHVSSLLYYLGYFLLALAGPCIFNSLICFGELFPESSAVSASSVYIFSVY